MRGSQYIKTVCGFGGFHVAFENVPPKKKKNKTSFSCCDWLKKGLFFVVIDMMQNGVINETEFQAHSAEFFKLCHQLVQIYLIMRMNGSVVFFQIKEVPVFYYPLSSHNKLLSMNLVVYACLVSFGADSMGGQQMINPQDGKS